MVNQDSLERIATSRQGAHFYRPAYDTYCFSRIPDTVRTLFNLPGSRHPLPHLALPGWSGYDQVVFFFIDAFGWQFFEKFADHPFLRLMTDHGIVSQMTSMFPSTTAAHITCIHTGQPVTESGVFEWFYFDPIVGKVISPLLFSLAGDKLNGREVREGLVQMGYTAAQLFPKTTLYNDLSQAGVTSYVFNHRDYARSTFSLYTNRGAELKPFMAWSEALANLSLLLEQPSAPRYYFLYYSAADALMHQYGPNSNQAEAEMLAWLDQMQRFITRLRSPRTLILVSADHGQTNTDPATSLAINHALPGLEAVLQRDPSSRPILFGGSPRDLFLYVQEPALLETAARIQAVLGARGEVKTSADLIAAGFFGPEPIPARLKARLGNLVILPYQGEAVYWHEKGRFEQNFYGHHGGLTAEEMLIPLMAFPT